MSSTKQEMLQAYNTLLKQLQEKSKAVLKPEEKVEAIKNKEILKIADSLSSGGIVNEIGNLKLEIGKMLSQLSDRLEEEEHRYKKVKEAISIKENELQEIYNIGKEAQTLAALIEAQSQKRQDFETEMASSKEELNREIQDIRVEWEKERKLYEIRIKERDTEESKRRQREKEEYEYAFKRQQIVAKNVVEDLKAKQDKEIQLKKEDAERNLNERERVIIEKENEINESRKKVETFPNELEHAVTKAIQETTEKIRLETENKMELFTKAFEGERNVLKTRIESLEKTTKDQKEHIVGISQQLEKAYQKLQDIAIKTAGGFSDSKSLLQAQQLLIEQIKKQSQEK